MNLFGGHHIAFFPMRPCRQHQALSQLTAQLHGFEAVFLRPGEPAGEAHFSATLPAPKPLQECKRPACAWISRL
jgi:hypothetical protein